jgi:folate-binding protein YgfZ
VAVLDRSGRGRIVVRGGDRASYLHGLLTNDITTLRPGDGCYAAYLTPQGRMITDLHVYELGDRMLLTLPTDSAPALLRQLDRLIFTEDVRLDDVTATTACIGVVGPGAAAAIGQACSGIDADLEALPLHASARGEAIGAPIVIVRTGDIGVPGFDLHVPRETAAPLMVSLRSAGAVDLPEAVAESLRIEAGLPRFGADMTEETIPLEAGIEARALSFTKGCYVGQEVIVRVLHRGHGRVARRLVGLTLHDAGTPAAGTSISADGKEIGRVTSSTWSGALQKPIALGYVHRDAAEPGTPVNVGAAAATVTALPFVNPGRPVPSRD